MPQSSGKKFTYSLIQKEAFGSLRSGVKACAKKKDTTIKTYYKGKKKGKVTGLQKLAQAFMLRIVMNNQARAFCCRLGF